MGLNRSLKIPAVSKAVVYGTFLTIANLAKEKDYQAWIFGKRAKHTNANDVPDKESRRTIDHLSVTI